MTQYNKDTYCSFAFTGYDNRTKWICCLKTGNLNSYDEANASEEVQNLRKDLLNGVKNPLCSQCWEAESVGLRSTRQTTLHELTDTIIKDEVENPRIKFLWLNGGSVCNLACRTCGPLWSSSLYKEDIDRYGSTWAKITKQDVSPYMNSDFSAIKQIMILGGEPFLNMEHVTLLEKIVADGHAKQCTLVYITNNTKRVPDRIKNIAKEFRSTRLSLSVDATDEQFAYVRTRGEWQTFVDNFNYIKQLQKDIPQINLGFQVTVSALNVMYLDKLWQWLTSNNKNLNFSSDVFTAFCLNPDYYSFNVFTDSEKKKIIDKLSHDAFDFSSIIKQIENSVFDAAARQKFFEELAWTKQYHNLDYEQTLSLLASVLEN